MVIICFVCGGFKKCFFYYLIVINSCNVCDGCFVECIGFFNLVVIGGEVCLFVDQECVIYWFGQGVQLFECVVQLFKDVVKVNV